MVAGDVLDISVKGIELIKTHSGPSGQKTFQKKIPYFLTLSHKAIFVYAKFFF